MPQRKRFFFLTALECAQKKDPENRGLFVRHCRFVWHCRCVELEHDPEKWKPVFHATNAKRVCAQIMLK